MSRMARLAALGGALVLLVAADAGAAVRVGSALNRDPDLAACPSTCTLVSGRTVLGVGSPIDGVVTRWALRTGSAATAPARLQIIRTTPDSKFAEVAGQDVTLAGLDRPTYPATPQMRIRRGDLLAVRATNVPLLVQELNTGNFRFTAPLGATPTPISAGTSAGGEVALAADVEPDRDDDGFGDDTQDACPTDPATQGACSGELVGPAPTGATLGSLGVSGDAYVDVGLGAAPRDGVMVRWRARGYESRVAGVLLRPEGGGAFRNVGDTGLTAESFLSETTGSIVTTPTRLTIRAGDRLGVRSGGFGGILLRSGTPGADLRRFTGGIAPDQVKTPTGSTPGLALLIGYDLEPDADRDGYGDVTQDGCPADAGTQGPCPVPAPAPAGTGTTPAPVTLPAPPAPPARVERVVVAPGAARLAATTLRLRGRAVAVPLSCAAEGGCRGTVELRRGRTRVGRATFRLAAGERRTVTVRLTARGARGLRRLTAVLTPAGPAASTRTVSVTR